VAPQVGELAARSAQAAKETNELITNSIKAIENGKEITDQTAEAFGASVEKIQGASQEVGEITNMVRYNVDIVAITSARWEGSPAWWKRMYRSRRIQCRYLPIWQR
jgi:Methyl-accepting chemotaxis protein